MTPIEPVGADRFGEDLRLVRASLAREPGAERRLLERLKCVPRILAVKNRRLGGILDSGELDDLAQETILNVWRKREEYRGRSSLESWVFTYCYHALMNRLRKARRRPPTIDLDAAEPPAEPRPDFSHLYHALGKLPSDEEDVLRARFFEQLSFAEIGALLETTTSVAKHRYYQGMDRLRKLLRSEEGR